MKWKLMLIVTAIILSSILYTVYVSSITSDDIKRNLGMTQIAQWAPGFDVAETTPANNYSYRLTIKYYNNASNLSAPYFNYTMNFTQMFELIGLNTTLSTLDNNSVRIYEVNAQGACVNESGVANGTCTSLAWGQVS